MRKIYILFLSAAFAIACIYHFSPQLAAQEAAPPEISESVPTHDTPSGKQADGGHHGPEVKLFGKTVGDAGQFFLKLLNFLIFGGLIFWLLKGALASAFRARTTEIEAKLAQSEKDRLEGETQLRELEAKMAGMEEELNNIMSRAEADAETEKQSILEAARTEADQILAQVQSEIEHQRRTTENELRELVAKLAIEGAEKRIQQRVQDASATKIMDQAIQQIGGAN